MSNSVFFSEDDEGFAGLKDDFEAAFDRAFKAHADAALQVDPDNALLREAILIGLSLQWSHHSSLAPATAGAFSFLQNL